MTRSTNARRLRTATSAPDLAARRIAALDWARIGTELDAHGCATTGALLTAEECAALEPYLARI